MHCLVLVISDSALLPLSATGGGRKATNRFGCITKPNKYVRTIDYGVETKNLFVQFVFAHELIGERGSPLQYSNHIVAIIKLYLSNVL